MSRRANRRRGAVGPRGFVPPVLVWIAHIMTRSERSGGQGGLEAHQVVEGSDPFPPWIGRGPSLARRMPHTRSQFRSVADVSPTPMIHALHQDCQPPRYVIDTTRRVYEKGVDLPRTIRRETQGPCLARYGPDVGTCRHETKSRGLVQRTLTGRRVEGRNWED